MSTESELVDSLPPTQYLMMEVLAARFRLGEQLWTFPSRLSGQARVLEDCGLVSWKSGIVQNTIMVSLTEKGKKGVLSETYTLPKHFWDIAVEMAEQAKQGLISTNHDFAELEKRGWTGCMHDSDCACTPGMRARDDVIIERYVQERDRDGH